MNFWSNFKNRDNLIIAHRGYSAKYPENTLLAFKKSFNKCDFFELDVAFSKDGVLVVLHDDTLNRTTNAKELSLFKEPYRVYDYTLEELKKLDASSWFNKNLPKQSIPTLKEVLAFVKEYNFPLNIEIKDMQDTKFHAIAAKEVVALIKEFNMQNRVIVSSFNHIYLKQVKAIEPTIDIAVLQELNHIDNLVEYLKSLNASSYNIDESLVDKALIQNLLKESIYTSVYTINCPNKKEELFNLGVKAIFTDHLE